MKWNAKLELKKKESGGRGEEEEESRYRITARLYFFNQQKQDVSFIWE